MRIDVVTANAFGPFKGEELQLAPGMTVVHGPNEAGKSSWYAALHSGLTGRRRVRGRGTLEQKRFRERHKPWHDRTWGVTVAVTLDDGRRLRFQRNLNTGDTVVTDLLTGQRPPGLHELEHEGSIDGSRLFGLNRDSAQATVFVAQADVLRVLQDADELQELLQRAAATTTVDTTVEQALGWIDAQRRLRVGQPNVGQRPLRAAQQELAAARQSADEARDAYDTLQGLLVARRRAQVELEGAEQEVQRLALAARWIEVARLSERVGRAHDLHARVLAASGPAPADPSLVRGMADVLAGFRDRGAEPVPAEGSTADELRADIAQLPPPPDGDTTPDPDVTAAFEQLRARQAELAAHLRTRPVAEQEPKVAASADELRALALALEASDEEADPALTRRVDQLRADAVNAQTRHYRATQEHVARAEALQGARAQYEADLSRYEAELAAHKREMQDYRRQLEEAAAQARTSAVPPPPPVRERQTSLLVAGAVLLLLAAVLAVAGAVPVAAAAAAAGVVLLALGVRGRVVAPPAAAPPAPVPVPAPPTPPHRPQPPDLVDPGQAPAAPAPDPALARAEAELALEEQTRAAAVRAREKAHSRVVELGLSADANALRRLAVQLEGHSAREAALAAWESSATTVRADRDAAEGHLRALLRTRAEAADDADPVTSYERYVEQCAQRGEQARAAARRRDLEEALRLREQADARHLVALEQHASIAERVLTAWSQVTSAAVAPEGRATSPDTAASGLQDWIDEQERLRSKHAEAQQLSAALDEVLDGVPLDDLEAELAATEGRAGPRPSIPLSELGPSLQRAERLRNDAAAAVHDLGGRVASQREGLPSVASAVEHEAQAERRLAQVQQLGTLLDTTASALSAAKEKVNANLAPVITARMRPWLPQVTGGRYSDLQVDPETLTVRVREPSGEYREATVLSHGTMEQVYLLLRLAIADLLSTNDESAPVALDDVTVQSDRARTEALLDLLHEISAERQVVLFSQEDEVLEWAKRALTSEQDRLVQLATA